MARSFEDIFKTGDFKAPSRFKGLPSITFSDEEISHLSARFRLALIGRFRSNRPSLISIRKTFDRIGFLSSFTISLLDDKHILIHFSSYDDFLRCLLRKIWKIDDSTVEVFRWTHDFDPTVESPYIPVWIGLEGLPIHLFDPLSLFSIANLIGRPLKSDTATSHLSRPSVARVCVELDLSKELPKAVWLHLGHLSFLQPITYEDLPDFCLSCKKFGHKTCKKPISNSRWIRRDKSTLVTEEVVAQNLPVVTAFENSKEDPNQGAVTKQLEPLPEESKQLEPTCDTPAEIISVTEVGNGIESVEAMPTADGASVAPDYESSATAQIAPGKPTAQDAFVVPENSLPLTVNEVPLNKAPTVSANDLVVHERANDDIETEVNVNTTTDTEYGSTDTDAAQTSFCIPITTIPEVNGPNETAITAAANTSEHPQKIPSEKESDEAQEVHFVAPTAIGCDAHQFSYETNLEGSHQTSIQNEEELPSQTTFDPNEFPVLSKESLKVSSEAHTPSLEREMEGTLNHQNIGNDDTLSDPQAFTHADTPPLFTNDAGVDHSTIGPVLDSFDYEGQHYEIRSYIEVGETSNPREEDSSYQDFQEVHNKRNKRGGKRQTLPRTIKTRSYDPNLEVGTVSEISRYWPSRKSTTQEKIITTKSYSGPFWYVGPVGPIGTDGKRPKKVMPRNMSLDQHPGFIIWE